jgi:hypothetical protein
LSLKYFVEGKFICESLELVSNTKENRTKLLFLLKIRVLEIFEILSRSRFFEFRIFCVRNLIFSGFCDNAQIRSQILFFLKFPGNVVSRKHSPRKIFSLKITLCEIKIYVCTSFLRPDFYCTLWKLIHNFRFFSWDFELCGIFSIRDFEYSGFWVFEIVSFWDFERSGFWENAVFKLSIRF